MRIARVAFVAAAIGAISGGGVVFSLIDRPAAEEASTAARTLVLQSDPAFVAMPRMATLQAPHEIGTALDHRANPQPARLADPNLIQVLLQPVWRTLQCQLRLPCQRRPPKKPRLLPHLAGAKEKH